MCSEKKKMGSSSMKLSNYFIMKRKNSCEFYFADPIHLHTVKQKQITKTKIRSCVVYAAYALEYICMYIHLIFRHDAFSRGKWQRRALINKKRIE